MVLLIIPAIIMIPGSISCNNNDNRTFTNDINSENVCTLSITDSIGIAQGDSNYVFGSVEDIDIGPDGSIYVLDKIQLTIFVYDSDGEFIRRIGQPGNGPGDLDNPGSIAVLGDGSICVSDGINPDSSQILYCSDEYTRVYFVILIHPSSTYCSSTTPESAFESLVSTAVYAASLRVPVMNPG